MQLPPGASASDRLGKLRFPWALQLDAIQWGRGRGVSISTPMCPLPLASARIAHLGIFLPAQLTTYATTCMNLEGIILSEISQSQRE